VEKKRWKNTRSQKILKRLSEVESADVTYVSETFPIVFHKAKGMRIADVDGNRYTDMTACFGVLALGHRHPSFLRSLRDQSSRLVHGMGDVHPSLSKVQLLETLHKLLPYKNPKSVLSLGGADAIESALKTAMLSTQRSQFISFEGGYHGLHLGALSLTNRETFTGGFEPWISKIQNKILPFPFNSNEKIPQEVAISVHGMRPEEEVLSLLKENLKTKLFAAVVLEPIQGRGGDREWPKGFLSEVKRLCFETGTLLIFDEIYTGFLRTGKMFALEHSGVVPDLLCLGKALGGGLPLSVCTGDAMNVWQKTTGEAKHTSTFLGHPLACAVATATLKELCRQKSTIELEMKSVQKLIENFAQSVKKLPHLTQVLEAHPFLLRGKGYMVGLWFWKSPPGTAAQISERLLKKGFVTLPSGTRGDVLSLTPPLVATQLHFRKTLEAVVEILTEGIFEV
jgi:4-aminobutyrate aminotransferase-like enzyme